MKNFKNKGFILMETLIVSVFITSVLIFLFAQVRKLTKDFDRSFSYNAVNSLYSVENIKNYLENNGYENLRLALINETYVDFSSCPSEYLEETLYCQTLFTNLNIKRVIITYENTDKLVNLINENENLFEPNLRKFIRYIKSNTDSKKNILIAAFNDGTYATLKIDY